MTDLISLSGAIQRCKDIADASGVPGARIIILIDGIHASVSASVPNQPSLWKHNLTDWGTLFATAETLMAQVSQGARAGDLEYESWMRGSELAMAA